MESLEQSSAKIAWRIKLQERWERNLGCRAACGESASGAEAVMSGLVFVFAFARTKLINGPPLQQKRDFLLGLFSFDVQVAAWGAVETRPAWLVKTLWRLPKRRAVAGTGRDVEAHNSR